VPCLASHCRRSHWIGLRDVGGMLGLKFWISDLALYAGGLDCDWGFNVR
jgi:hypothetical protein